MADPPPSSAGGAFPWRPYARALGLTVLFVYGAQLVVFFTGPLTGCTHCISTYLKCYAIVPGVLVGHWLALKVPALAYGAELLRFILPGLILTLLLLAAATVITASTRRLVQKLWLTLIATLSALNALAFAALLRM